MAQKPDNRLSVAIVGGGLGGVALAIGLLRHGISTHIYEAAAGFGEIGAGIMHGTNSVRAIGLISPDMLSAFKKCATYNTDPAKENTFIEHRYGTDSNNGNGKKSGDSICDVQTNLPEHRWTGTRAMTTVHRARFLDEIVKIIPEGTASFSKSLVDIVESDDGVRLYFADGSQAEASTVIGCDGIKSKTREVLFRNTTPVVPQYSGVYAYRSLVPRDIAIDVLGEDLTTNGSLWMGYGGYWITYPVDHGEYLNVVAMPRKEDWQVAVENLVLPGTREDLLNDWPGWDPRLLKLSEHFQSYNRWAIFDLIHDERYFKGRICLLGDAAHASGPHMGAGAGMAMEDAYILSNLLAGAKDSSDLERVFEAYDSVRRTRTQDLVRLSRYAAEVNELAAPGIMDNFEALKHHSDQRYRWIWNVDLEAQLEEAKQIMNKHIDHSTSMQ
ncbi:hypothetical protein BP6252_11937 [Coleophoma cylindrospora]|uniref:FAD-binding domain-containing protein n=1 Tax=Coleophoma cylindrospora TaxID=1849047 RepID=A0A3D8QGL3_9HELO|nr:hypothetical protein BP6252_11937 [Coleophoma cylindrospora]